MALAGACRPFVPFPSVSRVHARRCAVPPPFTSVSRVRARRRMVPVRAHLPPAVFCGFALVGTRSRVSWKTVINKEPRIKRRGEKRKKRRWCTSTPPAPIRAGCVSSPAHGVVIVVVNSWKVLVKKDIGKKGIKKEGTHLRVAASLTSSCLLVAVSHACGVMPSWVASCRSVHLRSVALCAFVIVHGCVARKCQDAYARSQLKERC